MLLPWQQSPAAKISGALVHAPIHHDSLSMAISSGSSIPVHALVPMFSMSISVSRQRPQMERIARDISLFVQVFLCGRDGLSKGVHTHGRDTVLYKLRYLPYDASANMWEAMSARVT